MYISSRTSTPNWVGAIALLCWASGSFLLSELKTIPVFEVLFISLGLSFFLTCIKLTIQGRWHCLKQPAWPIWLVGLFGLFGNDLCLVAATKFAPPAHVHLINYLWPTFVILFSGILPKEKWTMRYMMAGLIGFYGVYLLISQGQEDFEWSYHIGYLFAFMAAVVWSVYTLVIRHFGKTPPEMIGMYCGMGAFISLGCHLSFESFVWPQMSQWTCLVMIGCTTSCLAFYFWDYGTKYGNFRLLSILSYFNPLLGLSLLYALGKTTLSYSLVWSAMFIVCAPIVALFRWEMLKSLVFFGDISTQEKAMLSLK